MFSYNLSEFIRIAVFTVIAYFILVFFLRISGKRTLTQMDPFDFVVTTALGTTVATTVLSKNIPLLNGIVALAVLILLQYLISWLEVHYRSIRGIFKGRPTLLFYKGRYLREAMLSEHVPEVEILTAVREYGIASMEDVLAVVLEASSKISVIQMSDKEPSALKDVSPEPRQHDSD